MADRRTSSSLNPQLAVSRRLSVKKMSSFMQKLSGHISDDIIRTTLDDKAPKIDRNPSEYIQKTLTKADPQCGKNLVNYDYSKKQWVKSDIEEQLITVLSLESNIIHTNDRAHTTMIDYHRRKTNNHQKSKRDYQEIPDAELSINKTNRNLITYAERSSQTFNKVILTREVQTAKILRNNNSDINHKWDMFDRYVNKYIAIEEKKREEREKGMIILDKKKKPEKQVESLARPSLIRTLKLVERQIMQIINLNAYSYYRDWNKNEENLEKDLLLMLLAFPADGATIKNRSVTALTWNPAFEDIFAVGYGSYSFPKKSEAKDRIDDGEERSDDTLENGYIFVYSIKNNHHPEVKYITDSSVLSLDFHPTKSFLLVAGLYDGTICVYDIKQKIKTPLIICDLRLQRHMDPVWQVKWYPISDKEENIFFSVSSDGKVNKWSFSENKKTFEYEEMLLLKYSECRELSLKANPDSTDKENVDEGFIFGNAGGMCIDFNPHNNYQHLYLVGTEEGYIHLCSVNHRGHIMNSYEGHSMAVYNITWNRFHPKIFLSCSSDWSIKFWHYKRIAPLLVFDMQSAIGEVAWSPWCSTIFAAVTIEGEMKFYDLNRNRKTHIFKETYSKMAINHIAFNQKEYVFLTGNDRGKVRLWRMAEVLRQTIDKEEEKAKEQAKLENEKKANAIETKVNIPPHLVKQTTNKKKRVYESHTINHAEQVKKKEYIQNEHKRIVELLQHLDVDDY